MNNFPSSLGWGRLRVSVLAGILAFGLGGCSSDIWVRGNVPDPEVAAKINPGVHTRSDIQSLLGSPSALSTMSAVGAAQANRWYYIGQKSTQFAFFEPEVLERKVLVVSFDESGFVEATKTYDLADGQSIDPVDRITPTEGREYTFIQQLIGNLGRFTEK